MKKTIFALIIGALLLASCEKDAGVNEVVTSEQSAETWQYQSMIMYVNHDSLSAKLYAVRMNTETFAEDTVLVVGNMFFDVVSEIDAARPDENFTWRQYNTTWGGVVISKDENIIAP